MGKFPGIGSQLIPGCSIRDVTLSSRGSTLEVGDLVQVFDAYREKSKQPTAGAGCGLFELSHVNSST